MSLLHFTRLKSVAKASIRVAGVIQGYLACGQLVEGDHKGTIIRDQNGLLALLSNLVVHEFRKILKSIAYHLCLQIRIFD